MMMLPILVKALLIVVLVICALLLLKEVISVGIVSDYELQKKKVIIPFLLITIIGLIL